MDFAAAAVDVSQSLLQDDRVLVLEGELQQVTVDIESGVRALLFELKALAAVVGDDLHAELRTAGSEDLLQVLPRESVKSYRTILTVCLAAEVRV